MEKDGAINITKLTKSIVTALTKLIGRATITTDRERKCNSVKVNEAKQYKKLMRKQFNEACKGKNVNIINEIKAKYIESQKIHRKEIESAMRINTNETLQKLITNGNIDMNEFWKVRKQIMNKTREDYDIIDENNVCVKDPEKAKTHVADYFEDLYQAREGSNGYEAWTNHIEETVEKITKRDNNEDEMEHEVLTIYELYMNSATKALQKKKATGPDEIPNEALIETDKKSRQIILKAFNQVYKNETIPKEWQEGHIIRLYKGKGVKGKCSNERGLTLSSNLGKLYERIINNKITPALKMTNCQGGGKKGVSTADHIKKSIYIYQEHEET